MAAVDSLLKLIESRTAEALVVASGEIPILHRKGLPAPLSMPPLDASLVDRFVGEVVAGEHRARLDGERALDLPYEAADGRRYEVQARVTSRGYRLTFRPGATAGAGAAPAPGQPHAARAASAPAQPHAARPSAPGLLPSARLEPAPPAEPSLAPASGPPAEPFPDAAAQAAARAEAEALYTALARAEAAQASDVLLSTTGSRMRVGGQLYELDSPPCSEEGLLAALAPGLHPEQEAALRRSGSADLALDLRSRGLLRYRVNVFRQHQGTTAALRPIRDRVPTLAELGLPDSFYSLAGLPHGLVLVTGQAGSGKSTTLSALIEHLNRTQKKHILTLEDPIEHEYVSKMALVHQREVGLHVRSFGDGLRAALRESPDVILVGEMRDQETIAAALTAAETGHLVLSTLHCAGAAAAVARIIDVFHPHQQAQVRSQLASTLRAVITQYLLPSTRPPRRVPAYEKMVVNTAIAAMIREDKCHQIESQIQTGRAEGMVPLDRSLAALVQAGELAPHLAREVARDPSRLR